HGKSRLGSGGGNPRRAAFHEYRGRVCRNSGAGHSQPAYSNYGNGPVQAVPADPVFRYIPPPCSPPDVQESRPLIQFRTEWRVNLIGQDLAGADGFRLDHAVPGFPNRASVGRLREPVALANV